VTEALAEVRAWRIAAAVALTCLNYLVLIGYDAIALYYLEHSLSARRTAFGSIVGYAFSHNFGWIAGGSAVRFRLYSQWGFSAMEIAKLIATLTLTFWVGVFTLAGVAFLVDPLKLPPTILDHIPRWLPITTAFPLGIASLVIITSIHPAEGSGVGHLRDAVFAIVDVVVDEPQPSRECTARPMHWPSDELLGR